MTCEEINQVLYPLFACNPKEATAEPSGFWFLKSVFSTLINFYSTALFLSAFEEPMDPRRPVF